MRGLDRIRDPFALLLLVGVIYGNSFGGSFQYDDFHSIVHNPHIREIGNSAAFFVDTSMFSVDEDKAMYRPLLLLSFALNYAFHDYDTVGFHIVNVALHGLCVLLVWGIAIRMGYARSVALVVAAIFCAHPLATEPVNYISSRSELMGACFFLAAFRAFMEPARGFTLISLMLFVAGLLSKSVVIVLPVVLLLYDSWIRREKPVTARHLPFASAAALYVVILFLTRFLDASLRVSPRMLDVQIYTQLKAVVFYLKLLFIPVGLNVEHQFFASDGPLQPAVLLGALIAVSSTALAWRLMPRRYLFWLCWAGIVMAPATLTPLNVLVNEHRLYLSVAGLALMGGAVAPFIRGTFVRPIIILALIMSSFSVMQRNEVWADEMSLWTDSAAKSPNMVRPFVHLGNAYRQVGDFHAASSAYRRALAIDSTHRAANTNLANLHLDSGLDEADSTAAAAHFVVAVDGYQAVLEVDSTYREALGNLAIASMKLGRLEEAEQVYLEVVRHHPHFADGYYNLGLLYTALDQFDDADGQFELALGLDPLPDTHHEQGKARVGQGRLIEAADSFRAAWSGDRGNDIYAENLSRVLLALGERAFVDKDSAAGSALWREAESCLEKVVHLTGSDRARLSLDELRRRRELLRGAVQ